jgi:copper chaperone CopZ
MEDAMRLNVPEMKTDRCRATVMSVLMGVDGTADCRIDAETNQVQVSTKFPPSDFIEALEEVGYTSFIAQV